MTKKSKTKFLYYFRGDLGTHVQFFLSWTNALRDSGIPMELITFLNIKTYLRQYQLVKKYRSPQFHIYIDSPFSIISSLYFFLTCFIYKKTIIQLKKRSPKLFDNLKILFPKKLIYIIEGEGDPFLEYDYLKKHPYQKGFYNEILKNLKHETFKQKKIFQNADYLIFGYKPMKDMLCERYPDLNLEKKIILNPMSFKKNVLFFSPELRNIKRYDLKIENRFTLLYMGNAFYSWQNVFRTIEIFKLIKNNYISNSFLILLIRKQDFDIVLNFLNKLDIKNEDYILKNVPFEEINNYLNAADIGISLRHDHKMNETTPSGKILEYLGCGLPVITTKAMGDISNIVEANNFGVVLENMDDNTELLHKIKPFLKVDEIDRITISKWANEYLSIDAKIYEYVKNLKKLD